MADDFALAEPGPTDIPPIPPSSPPLDAASAAIPKPASALDEELETAALATAGSWKLLATRDRCRFCNAKWRESSRRIEEIIRALKSNPSDPDHFSEDERWFLENARLLRGAIQEVRSSLSVFQKIHKSWRRAPMLDSACRAPTPLPRLF